MKALVLSNAMGPARVGQALFDEVVWEADRRGMLSDENFSVDGTLIEAMASIKNFRRREDQEGPPDDDPGNPWVDFRGERLKNETHESRTDPEARLMRKGQGREARLSFMGHMLMENGNGLLMDFLVSRATGVAEREAVPVMLDDARQRGYRPRTLGADKGYDTRECVRAMRNRGGDAPRGSENTLGYRRGAPRGTLATGRVRRYASSAE